MNCLLINRGKRHTFKKACKNFKLSHLLICNYCNSFLNNKSNNTNQFDKTNIEENGINNLDNNNDANLFDECNIQNNRIESHDLNGLLIKTNRT
jgi:hypothetical protein